MVLIEIELCQAETMRVIGKAEEYVRKNKLEKGQIWCVYDIKKVFLQVISMELHCVRSN